MQVVCATYGCWQWRRKTGYLGGAEGTEAAQQPRIRAKRGKFFSPIFFWRQEALS